MKTPDLPPAFVSQVLVCPDCGHHFPIPDDGRALARTGHMFVLHCANCQEVCQGRFFVPQPDIHAIARLEGKVR